MKNKAILIWLPVKIVAEIDKEVSRGQYPSRSEYIRDLIRDGLEEKNKRKDTFVELQKLARKNLRQYGIRV